MDADELLARTLQAEELQSSKHAQESKFRSKLEGALSAVQKCEDPLLQALALSVLPSDDLDIAAQRALDLARSLNEPQQLHLEDYWAIELLTWFKTTFFSWMDRPKCCFCENPDTTPAGVDSPTLDEQRGDATKTELYECPLCSQTTRFPRYNDLQKLLETRCGRCGEWANAFLLFCRAGGLNARYVLDWTDHVWTEYYSTALKRWVHMDSCEAAWDKPLLYEVGWGKQLTYVVAVGVEGLVDVTRRYTKSWSALAPRRVLVSEAYVSALIGSMNERLRAGADATRRAALQAADLQEQLDLLSCGMLYTGDLSLPARTTGSEEWRNARGESGRQEGGGAGPAPTRFRPIPPRPAGSAAWDRHNGAVVEGACRASGDNVRETAERAFDGTAATKWLDFNGGGVAGTAWLELRLLGRPLCVLHYDVVSANDCPERNPCSWVLEGLEEGEGQQGAAGAEEGRWQALDVRRGVSFPGRHALLSFQVASPRPCISYRLRVTATARPQEANSVQISCVNLYSSESCGPATPLAPLSERVHAGLLARGDGAAAAPLGNQDLTTLRKLISNLEQSPKELKFRRVRLSKVASLLEHPLVVQLMMAVGFRLLVLSDAGGLPDTFLVMGEDHEDSQWARLHTAAKMLESVHHLA